MKRKYQKNLKFNLQSIQEVIKMEIKQKYKYLIKGGRHTDLKFVGETNDVVEAKQIIQDYINKHIKKCYYQRINFYEKYIWLWKLE